MHNKREKKDVLECYLRRTQNIGREDYQLNNFILKGRNEGSRRGPDFLNY